MLQLLDYPVTEPLCSVKRCLGRMTSYTGHKLITTCVADERVVRLVEGDGIVNGVEKFG